MVPSSLILLLATVGWLGGRIVRLLSAVIGWRLAVLAPIVVKVGQSMGLVSCIWCWILQRLIGSSAHAHDTSCRYPSGATLTETAEAQADHQYEEPETSSSSNDDNPLGIG